MRRIFLTGLLGVVLAGCQTYPPVAAPPEVPLDRSQVRMFDWRPVLVRDQYTGRQVESPNAARVYYFHPPGNPRPKSVVLRTGEAFAGFRLAQIVPRKGMIPPWLVFRDLRTGGERPLRQMVTQR